MIIGTEASHMVLASLWEGLIKLEGFEEDEEQVESKKDATDGEDLNPHQ